MKDGTKLLIDFLAEAREQHRRYKAEGNPTMMAFVEGRYSGFAAALYDSGAISYAVHHEWGSWQRVTEGAAVQIESLTPAE